MSNLAQGYTLSKQPPSVAVYRGLREGAGLSGITERQAAASIAGTWAWRTVTAPDGSVVAMGRVVGDGGWYFLVADMATLPSHQGRGIGRAVLSALLEEIRERAEPRAYVTLTADPPGRELYASLGFVDVSPGQTGMALVL